MGIEKIILISYMLIKYQQKYFKDIFKNTNNITSVEEMEDISDSNNYE